MKEKIDYSKCSSETDILKVFASRFSDISDFSIETEKKMIHQSETHIFDIVVNYREQPVAIAEIKKQMNYGLELKNYLKRQLDYYRRYDSVKFFFSIVGKDFYSYDSGNEELVAQSEKDVFEVIIKTMYEQSEVCDELVDSIRNRIKKNDKWEVYQEKLLKYLKKGSLRKIGNTIFLDEDQEKRLMHELLWMNVDRNEKKFCRYTLAKSFYLSLKFGFRLMDVENMNDELETKVIADYPNLNPVRLNLSNYVYNGFIMCFSRMSRFDKLFNWYMYGDRAKGICYRTKRAYWKWLSLCTCDLYL